MVREIIPGVRGQIGHMAVPPTPRTYLRFAYMQIQPLEVVLSRRRSLSEDHLVEGLKYFACMQIQEFNGGSSAIPLTVAW